MKIKLFILLFLSVLFVSSCEKDEKSYEFEAVVQQIIINTISCTPEIHYIKITQGLKNIESYTYDSSITPDSIYTALNLPEELDVPGLTIKLNLRKPTSDELPSCYAGELPVLLTDPFIYISEAEKK